MNKYISNVPEAVFKWVPALSVYGVSAIKILTLMNTDLKVSNILPSPDMYSNFSGSTSFQVKRIK